MIYNELKLAQQHLILSNYGHLLYLIMCFHAQNVGDELFAADASILFRIYKSADANTLALFKRIGFTEALAVKIAKTQTIKGVLELGLNRLFKALVLMDTLNLVPLPEVASKYSVERGALQTLIGQTVSAAGALARFCQNLSEFWCFEPLFQRISKKINNCCTAELESLMDLPSVKINRAKQIYSAGYKTIEDIARATPMDLVNNVQHLHFRAAKEIIAASKIIVMKRLDDLEEAADALKIFMQPNNV